MTETVSPLADGPARTSVATAPAQRAVPVPEQMPATHRTVAATMLPGVTLLNRFTVHGASEEFEAAFAATSSFLSEQPGFVEHTLMRQVDEPASYINLARWANAAALSQAVAHPDFYQHAVALRQLCTTAPAVFAARLHVSSG